MKVELHYSIGDYDDCIVLSGDTEGEIMEEIQKAMSSRGLERDKNYCWTKDID